MTYDEVSRLVMWVVGLGVTIGGGLISWALWSLGAKQKAMVDAVVTPILLRLGQHEIDMKLSIREAIQPLEVKTALHEERLKHLADRIEQVDATKASRSELSKISAPTRHDQTGPSQASSRG